MSVALAWQTFFGGFLYWTLLNFKSFKSYFQCRNYTHQISNPILSCFFSSLFMTKSWILNNNKLTDTIQKWSVGAATAAAYWNTDSDCSCQWRRVCHWGHQDRSSRSRHLFSLFLAWHAACNEDPPFPLYVDKHMVKQVNLCYEMWFLQVLAGLAAHSIEQDLIHSIHLATWPLLTSHDYYNTCH